MDTFAEELGFVVFLFENGDILSDTWADNCLNIISDFDLLALERNEWDRIGTMIESCRDRLVFLREKAKTYKVHLVGHAHLDMNWLWPWSETLDLIRRDFESMVGIMEQFPQVCFSHSQAATYQLIQQMEPLLWLRVKRLIESGRWEVTASTWVEGDLNMGMIKAYEIRSLQLNRDR